jgi:peptidoglycan hydrolase CwlO-like protein
MAEDGSMRIKLLEEELDQLRREVKMVLATLEATQNQVGDNASKIDRLDDKLEKIRKDLKKDGKLKEGQ